MTPCLGYDTLPGSQLTGSPLINIHEELLCRRDEFLGDVFELFDLLVVNVVLTNSLVVERFIAVSTVFIEHRKELLIVTCLIEPGSTNVFTRLSFTLV